MPKRTQADETAIDDHASSIEWLIASIDYNKSGQGDCTCQEGDETPSQMLKRRFSGVEPRWWTSVLLFTAVWLTLLYLFGYIADGMQGWPWMRFVALLLYLVTLVYVSREFGARFRALNDRSDHPHETTWAMISGWLLIGIVAVSSEPMKKLASDFTRYDTMTSTALVSWIYLFNAALKLPWDKATDQRKSAHKSWVTLAKTGLLGARTLATRILVAATASRDPTLEVDYHRQLAEWDRTYSNWRPAWRKQQSVDKLAQYQSQIQSTDSE